jgi:hypothetical protein
MNGPVQVLHLRRRAVRFVFRFDKKLPEPDLNRTLATLNQQVHISCNRKVKQSLAFEDVRTSSAEVVLTTKCNKIPRPIIMISSIYV